jgi:hypothetical protein
LRAAWATVMNCSALAKSAAAISGLAPLFVQHCLDAITKLGFPHRHGDGFGAP